MIVIANVCPKLQTLKILVRPLSNKRCFRKRFDSQHVQVPEILPKSPWEQFCQVFSSFWGKLIWKKSPLVLDEILGVFGDTLTADGRYPVQYCENLLLTIQMPLSEKRKFFSEFFVPLLKFTSNFKHFVKRMIVIANVFPILQTIKNLLRSLSKKGYWEQALTVNMWKCPKYLQNLHETTFIMFFHHFERNWSGIVSPTITWNLSDVS